MKYNWPKKETTWIDGRTLFVSVPFTWKLPDVRELLRQRSFFWDNAIVGGPAVKLMPEYLADIPNVIVDTGNIDGVLQRINPHATRTTTGCPNKCRFCAVPVVEGKFIELDDWPDLPIICDNNLMYSSISHFDKVCDRLEKHKWSDFNQGLDARLLNEYHAERLARLPNSIIRLASRSA